ncbi:O-methyltransferase-domain-containing protein [Hypoxylon rubiginosum]|uniref:O-methyltransferase-domain-containing protein n=1 Tax=Hypoxylon rubiginosum TaxID=110542 RepID=A0ACC0D7T7_9PEZI|nr:O-methyltransferase-domain-containing protein [Hypoxylon rubiginosum]
MSSNQTRPLLPDFNGYFPSIVELTLVRMFMKHGVFKAIPADGILLSKLSQELNMDHAILERFSNFLVTAGILSSPTPGYVALTPKSELCCLPLMQLCYTSAFDSIMNPVVQWSKYFGPDGLQDPNDIHGLSVKLADPPFHESFRIDPEQARKVHSAILLSLISTDMPITGIYNFGWVVEYSTQAKAADRALLVAVEGGQGQALAAILNENPEIPPGSCVLQGQVQEIEEAVDATGILGAVKKVTTTPFDEQPTKGALIYYIRRALTGWSDDECIRLLKNIRRACAMDSRVLINECLLPEEPSISVAAEDLFLLKFGGKKRNEKMFAEIATRAGFKITRVLKDLPTNSAVLELVPIE